MQPQSFRDHGVEYRCVEQALHSRLCALDRKICVDELISNLSLPLRVACKLPEEVSQCSTGGIWVIVNICRSRGYSARHSYLFLQIRDCLSQQ